VLKWGQLQQARGWTVGDATIIQISDPHLSRTHGFFNHNWRALMPRLASAAPALVVVSGDLTVDGADSVDDLAWAAAELERIRASPWVSLPGNHDIGEEQRDVAHGQTIDPKRCDRWIDRFGHDWWVREAGAWRLIGIDSQLLGSGLGTEAVQWAWLEATLAADPQRPTGIFLHKPLFLEAPDEPDLPGHAIRSTPSTPAGTLLIA
jgi:3',5'-cyclic AMP phosphodiesterase CpdA